MSKTDHTIGDNIYIHIVAYMANANILILPEITLLKIWHSQHSPYLAIKSLFINEKSCYCRYTVTKYFSFITYSYKVATSSN